MKTRNFIPLLAFLICMLTIPQSSTAQLSKIQKWQQPSYFKGFNIEQHGWYALKSRFLNQQDFIDMKNTCANLVVITTYGTWDENSPYAKKLCGFDCTTTYIEEWIDTLVSYAKVAGLHYVISLRTGPGFFDGDSLTTNDSIWKSSLMQQKYASMVKEIAGRYLGDSLFVGIAPMNEPHPCQSCYGATISTIDSMLTANPLTDVNQFMKYCIDSVRIADPNLPVIVESINWAAPFYFYFMQKQTDSKVVYSTHFYDPVNFTLGYDENIDLNINAFNYPANYWESVYYENSMYYDKAFLKDSVSKFIRALQTTYNVPILMGEFGLVLPQVGGEQYLTDLYDIAIEYDWNFAIWSWRGSRGANYEVLDSLSNLPTAATQIASNYWNTVQQMMCPITGLFEIENKLTEDLILYPNPAEKIINIKFTKQESAKYELTLYNIFGQIVYQAKYLSENLNTIDIGKLNSGIYLLHIKNQDEIIIGTKKIIIK